MYARSLMALFGFFVLWSLSLPVHSKTIGENSKALPDRYVNKWSILIGLDRFEDDSLNTNLKLDDVSKELKEALLKDANFNPSGTLVLENEEASRDAILSSLGSDWLGKVCGEEDLALVFINTLCFPSDNGQVYILPYDTDLDNFYSSAISLDQLLETLKQKIKAKDIVVVAQTQFTGAPQMVSGARAKFGIYNLTVDSSKLGKNMAILSSSRESQPTWGSYFSDSFIRVLKQKGKSNSGNMDLGAFFKYVHDDTIQATVKDCRGCKIQTPAFYGSQSMKSASLTSVSKLDANKQDKSETVLKFEKLLADLGKARALMKYGKSLQALEFLASCHGDLGEKAMTSYLSGLVYSRRQDWDKASASFQKAVLKAPNRSLYNSQLANALVEAGKDPGPFFKRAYQLDPKNLDGVFGISESGGNGKESLRVLKGALADYPSNPELHDRLSLAYGNLGSYKTAIQHAHQAIMLDDRSWPSFMNLGSLLVASGKPNEAQAAFRKVLEIKPDSMEGYYMLANALEKTSDPEGAISALEEFIKLSCKEDNRVSEAKEKVAELRRKFLSGQ